MAGYATDNMLAWRIVQETAAHGEITAVARKLDLDAPKVSRLLNALEYELGFAVFDRSTRPFTVTIRGKHLLNSVQVMLEAQRHLKNVCRRSLEEKETIHIRFGIATGTDASFLVSLLTDYKRVDPELSISIVDHACLTDLKEGRIQIAYLPYLVKEASFLCVPVTTVFTVSAASPAYLSGRPAPMMPEDLCEHTVILRSDEGYPEVHGLWKHQFYRAFTAGSVLRLDNRLALQAALEGLGIVLDVPMRYLQKPIRERRLVPCLNGWHRQCWHYSLVCRSDVLSEYSPIGNFLEWAQQRLQRFENKLWQQAIREAGEAFPISLGTTTEEDFFRMPSSEADASPTENA